VATFDDYLAEQTDDAVVAALTHIREVVRRTAGGAEEGTSYGMPAWRLEGKPLIGINVAKAHIGVFPFSTEVVDAVRDQLADFEVSKGGMKCTPAHLIPDDVIAEMVRLRSDEILGPR
jgi:uncharacterized protein YdhG (YjbR/CyaY superfamily)